MQILSRLYHQWVQKFQQISNLQLLILMVLIGGIIRYLYIERDKLPDGRFVGLSVLAGCLGILAFGAAFHTPVVAEHLGLKSAGINEQSLRLYERQGLLTPTRSKGGTRRYSADDLVRLQRIIELVAAGVNLAGVARILERHTLGLVVHRFTLCPVSRGQAPLQIIKRTLRSVITERCDCRFGLREEVSDSDHIEPSGRCYAEAHEIAAREVVERDRFRVTQSVSGSFNSSHKSFQSKMTFNPTIVSAPLPALASSSVAFAYAGSGIMSVYCSNLIVQTSSSLKNATAVNVRELDVGSHKVHQSILTFAIVSVNRLARSCRVLGLW